MDFRIAATCTLGSQLKKFLGQLGGFLGEEQDGVLEEWLGGFLGDYQDGFQETSWIESFETRMMDFYETSKVNFKETA